MKKTLLYIGFALLSIVGFSSCDGEQELPPFTPPANFTGSGTQDDPYSVSKAVALIKSEDCPTTEVFVKGVISQIDEVDPSYGNATFYIVDELGSEVNLEVYRCKYLGNTKFSSAEQIKVGDEVIVYGKVENFRDKYPEMTQGCFIYELNGVNNGGVPDTPAQGTTAEPAGEGTQAAPYNVAKAIQVITGANCPTEEVYIEGVIAKIQEVDATQYGNATFYIADEGFSTQLYIYRVKYLGNTKFTAADQIKVGDKVVMYGKVENFKGNTPEMTQGGYIYSLNGQTAGGEDPSTPGTPDTPAGDAIFSEAFNNTQGQFTINDVNLPAELKYVWSATEKYGMKASAYVNNANYAAESWLISPVIDLSNVTDATLTFDHALNFFADVATAKNEASVWARVDGGEWQQLTDVAYPATMSWDFASAGNISLKAFAGKKMQFAFKYTSTAAKSGTWEVKNVVVK